MMSHGYDRDGNKVDKGTRSIPEAAVLFTLVTATRYKNFKTLLVRWIVYYQVAFVMLENETLRGWTRMRLSKKTVSFEEFCHATRLAICS